MAHPLLPRLRLLSGALAVAIAGCTGGDSGGGPGGILDDLAAIDGLTVNEEPTDLEGYRFFVLTFDQPADHDAPAGARFTQRMTLLHRDAAAPVIFATNGYGLAQDDRRSEPTILLGANQLAVEHRYFPPSRPAPTDWTLLNIRQAASDHHRIVEAIAPLYPGKWISTGVSKGGMTAVYHRRFFPADVDATIAYVAPLSSGPADDRYVTFLEQVGDAPCRQALIDFQRDALGRRTVMLQKIMDLEAAEGVTFDLLGGREVAFEHAVLELPFAFWQYGSAAFCDSIPGGAASDDEVYGFLDAISSFAFFADDVVLYYEPYFFQAATQLGYPAISETAVADLLVYPGTDNASTYVTTPASIPAFDGVAMTDIAGWVTSEAATLMFIYGSDDPWSAGAFSLGAATDSFLYTVPGGNHGASISDLAPADRAEALGVLEAWTGVTPMAPAAATRRAIERTPL